MEPELEQSALRGLEALVVLRSAEPLGQVDLVQAGHRARSYGLPSTLVVRRRVASMRLASVIHQGAPHAARLSEDGESAVLLDQPDVGALLQDPAWACGRGRRRTPRCPWPS